MTHSILVIGSEPTFRDKLAAAFREAGFAVAAVPDYTGTLLEQNGFKPNLVIMDETLPSGDSMEACYQLRNIFDVPVVLFGNSSSKEGWRRVMQADADAYLAKPVWTRELIARVKALLRRYDAQQMTDLQSRLKLLRGSAESTQEEENE
ncbi:MAG: response regulator transcription factor [Chloroflexi bacterium]|nr:response regulator transcription factor [Chloroflexota bacterium]